MIINVVPLLESVKSINESIRLTRLLKQRQAWAGKKSPRLPLFLSLTPPVRIRLISHLIYNLL